jgi:hypothetical protein
MYALNALTGHLGLSTKEENSKQKGYDQTQSEIFIKYMRYANICNRSQYNSKV